MAKGNLAVALGESPGGPHSTPVAALGWESEGTFCPGTVHSQATKARDPAGARLQAPKTSKHHRDELEHPDPANSVRPRKNAAGC